MVVQQQDTTNKFNNPSPAYGHNILIHFAAKNNQINYVKQYITLYKLCKYGKKENRYKPNTGIKRGKLVTQRSIWIKQNSGNSNRIQWLVSWKVGKGWGKSERKLLKWLFWKMKGEKISTVDEELFLQLSYHSSKEAYTTGVLNLINLSLTVNLV